MRVWGFSFFFFLGCAPSYQTDPLPVPVTPTPIEVQQDPFPSPEQPISQEPPPAPALEPCKGHAYLSNVPFLKGQLHVHSDRSFDAATPVEDVIAFYAKRGYDFISITDHNHVTVPKEHPSGLLTISGVELTYNAATCDPPPRPGYLCAFHAGVLFLNPMRDVTRGRHFNLPFRRQRLEVWQNLLARAEDLDGVFVLNHPTFHYAIDETQLDELVGRGVRLVEFFNAGVIDHDKAGPTVAIQQAEALWTAMLDRGHPVIAVGGDDAHHFADAATIRMTGKKPLLGDRVWVMVRAQRSVEAIREAFIQGDFYVSTGVRLSELEVSDLNVHLRIDPREGQSYSTTFVGQGGRILAQVDGTEACFPTEKAEGYVRAVVQSDDGEMAWTQAVMLESNDARPSPGPIAKATGNMGLSTQ
ncbi:MAG TPA: CehA/McbA family metallohydrolase [Polyangiaceae bacterium]|nr:MAG: PHP domain protein [Deltaproteobacteria bacterium ADurb.Bin207]HNS96495.1 CehA/McbA family metallohydrolase [Polyangiaceae bacterium]HNZ24064.1 CehA/McbA family metallohydrolase [Polyangiaceae bacterium]HOD21855.1 CehA/McbA family metallohydrolase [Polyangiaceae bacterium]HOE49921.1 CehA/McbA family metallohydrolase [Polyangiaceae bacterium]